MAVLTIEALKKLIENVPNDYTVECSKGVATAKVKTIEIDISGKRLILK